MVAHPRDALAERLLRRRHPVLHHPPQAVAERDAPAAASLHPASTTPPSRARAGKRRVKARARGGAGVVDPAAHHKDHLGGTPSTTTIAGQIALHPAPIRLAAFVHAVPTASPQGLSALSYTVAAHEGEGGAGGVAHLAHVHADETVDDGGEGHPQRVVQQRGTT